MNVASWTSRSAPWAATRTMSHGAVSPESTILRPAPLARRPARAARRRRSRRAAGGRSPGPRDAELARRARRRSGRAARPRRARSRRPAAVADRERARSRSRRARPSLAGSSSTTPAGSAAGRRRGAAPRISSRGAGRAVDRQRPLAVAQLERLEHPRQAEPVVGVEVGEEDRRRGRRARPSAAAGAGCPRRSRTACGPAAADSVAGQPAARGRHGAGGAGEDDARGPRRARSSSSPAPARSATLDRAPQGRVTRRRAMMQRPWTRRPTTSTPCRSSASCPSAALLAKSLRADGGARRRAAVAALPKPSVAAWAVNQVVRSQPDARRGAVGAGRRGARGPGAGRRRRGSGAELREAMPRERRALTRSATPAAGR